MLIGCIGSNFSLLIFFVSREQMKQMEEHVQKYAEHYPLKNFAPKQT